MDVDVSVGEQAIQVFGNDSSLPEETNNRYRCFLCSRTYERQDHLSRHLKSHDNERKYRCSECNKGFNRADLLNRHRAGHSKDGEVEIFRRRTGKACQACVYAKTKCEEERPCKRCKLRNKPCVPSESQRLERSSMTGTQASSPTSTSRDDEAAQAIVSLSTNNAFQPPQDFGDAQDYGPSNDLQMADLDFSDFFDSIMMPGTADGTHQDPVPAPPDVSNFTLDDFGPLDFDFKFLAGGLTRPSSAQGFRDGDTQTNLTDSTPQSEAGLRSEAFKKSPWSWNHWIPERSQHTFTGQDEINILEQRVNADDQLTPRSERRFHAGLENEARDRMIRVVTQIADSRLAVPSFPSLELLEDLIDVFLMQESSSIDSFIHTASFDTQHTSTELLLAMVSAGATFIALEPVWKMGLVFQEVVRIGVASVFERDNSTTRQLQPLQTYLLWLKIGVWSGFRRKTEIANSFLQPAQTMLMWSNAFAKHRYKDIIPTRQDDDKTLTAKWKAWVEQESFKRLVVYSFIYDSQVSIAFLKNPLISPAQMMLPLPASRKLWSAQNAHAWRNLYLSEDRPKQTEFPSVMAIVGNVAILDEFDSVIDKALTILIACHCLAYEVFAFRQQAILLTNGQNQPRRDRWLAHMSRQKELYDELSTMYTYVELQSDPDTEALFTLEYLMMNLHASLDDIQLFSGRSGEDEARRVYPQIRAWTEDSQSRIAIRHAGKALGLARKFEKTRLRDFYTVGVYMATLTLWVYGIVTSAARKSGIQTPRTGRTSTNVNDSMQQVLLDGEDDRAVKAFLHLGHGKPGLRRADLPTQSNHSETTGSNFCPLQNSRGVMLLAAELLRDNYPRGCSGLPPLVQNLTNLMSELSKLCGRDYSS